MEFDANCIPSKDAIGRCVYKAFRPSIKLSIVKKDQKLDNWDDLIKKTIRVKTKANLQLASIICKIH